MTLDRRRNDVSTYPTTGGRARTTGPDLRTRLLDGAPVNDRRVLTEGVSTAVIEGGEGPQVVLLHGQGASAVQWLPTMLRLLSTHRTVAPDLPGLGGSEVAAGPPTPELVMAWLAGLIASRCPEPPVLVGVSLGGSIAVRFAARHSDLLSGLVLVGTGGLGRRVRPRPAVMRALIRHELRPTRRTTIGVLASVVADVEALEGRMGDRWDPFIDYLLDRSRTPSVRQANRRLLRELGLPGIADDLLGGIGVPTTLVWGVRDPVAPVAVAEHASRRHGWPLHLIEGVGHLPHVEAPDEFVRSLRRALDD